jgi:iron complex outermembrane receptor protein
VLCAAAMDGILAPEVMAADAAVTGSDSPPVLVTVTASRVRREGYVPSTPTTVLMDDDLAKHASDTLGDLLSQLPQMRNPATEGTSGEGFTQSVGRAFANLRGLGTNRTLVLLDGQRLVSNDLYGDRDILILPSALINRVDVVTGGRMGR